VLTQISNIEQQLRSRSGLVALDPADGLPPSLVGRRGTTRLLAFWTDEAVDLPISVRRPFCMSCAIEGVADLLRACEPVCLS